MSKATPTNSSITAYNAELNQLNVYQSQKFNVLRERMDPAIITDLNISTLPTNGFVPLMVLAKANKTPGSPLSQCPMSFPFVPTYGTSGNSTIGYGSSVQVALKYLMANVRSYTGSLSIGLGMIPVIPSTTPELVPSNPGGGTGAVQYGTVATDVFAPNFFTGSLANQAIPTTTPIDFIPTAGLLPCNLNALTASALVTAGYTTVVGSGTNAMTVASIPEGYMLYLGLFNSGAESALVQDFSLVIDLIRVTTQDNISQDGQPIDGAVYFGAPNT